MITREIIQAGSLNELQLRMCKLVKDGKSNFTNRSFKLRNTVKVQFGCRKA